MSARAADKDFVPHRQILIIVVALILYGSLYPWDFHLRHYPRSPLWILAHAWPSGPVTRYFLWDFGVNVTLYAPLGIFAYLALRGSIPPLLRVLAALALGLGLSASIEMLQLFDDGRMCSLADVAANVTGTAVGIVAGVIYRAQFQRLLHADGAASLLRPSGALLLLTCWLGYHLFPLFPSWGRTHLLARIAAMGPLSSISLLRTFLVFSEWIAAACLLEIVLAHARRLKADRAFVLMLLVVPLRLIIASRTLEWAEVAGAAAALIAWLALPRASVRRCAPALLAVALVLSELAPFHFGRSVARFDWVPFRATFRSAWQDGLVILFRKSFWYGSVIWLWREAGYRLAWTVSATAVALLLLESLQLYLPGRTPEITDPALALLMGILLWLLRDS